MKSVLTSLFLLLTVITSFSQNTVGVGTRLTLSGKSYHFGYSENQTDITYKKPAFEIIGMNSIYAQNDSSKFSLGYTFEVGLSFLTFTKNQTTLPLHPSWKSDTIGHKKTENYRVRKLHITNFIDFRYKINTKLTLINSIGFKIENKDGFDEIDNSNQFTYIYKTDNFQDNNSNKRETKTIYNYENHFPFNFKLIVVPQLQIEFDQFSIKIQIYQDLFNLNNHIKRIDVGSINYTTFTGLGIVLSTPHKERATKLYTNEDTVN